MVAKKLRAKVDLRTRVAPKRMRTRLRLTCLTVMLRSAYPSRRYMGTPPKTMGKNTAKHQHARPFMALCIWTDVWSGGLCM
eukprot:5639299-Pyramimonas_sp.AAC.1